jgi:ribokinase
MARPTGGALDVIVVGSANVDLVVRVARLPRPGETVTGGTFERHGGGKGANAAVAAARAGAAVRLVGAVGDDEDGEWLRSDLAAAGVDVAGVTRVAGQQTGRALIAVAESGENQIAVASGANAALDGSMVATALAAGTPSPDAVCLLGFEVGDAALQAAVGWAATNDVRVVVNPAPPRALTAWLIATRPIVTPNEGEALALAGVADVDEAATRLAREVGGAVVVTIGPDGVLLAGATTKGVTRIPAPRVAAVDTTGAGDAFNGALVARLALGEPLERAVPWAVAAAALKVTRRGARSSPRAGEVESFLTRTESSALR